MAEGSKKAAYLEKAKEAEKQAARAKSSQDRESWERVARVYNRLAESAK